MKTAEEFFRDKIRELEPNKAVIALRHEIVNAEQAMRWAHEFKELHFAEFSSQDKWVSVEKEFIYFVKQERVGFCKALIAIDTPTKFRTHCDSLLIAYDQMIDRFQPSPPKTK